MRNPVHASLRAVYVRLALRIRFGVSSIMVGGRGIEPRTSCL